MSPRPTALLLALCGLLAACGGGGASPPRAELPRVDVALDFTPNAVHAPLFTAVREGLDRRNGVRLRIRQPAEGPDALKLVAAGRLDLGVLDIHDLAIARSRGTDLVAVAALIDRPLAALIARAGVVRPRDLEGTTIGVSGLPSDPAFVAAIVRGDGGDPSRAKQVTIGFNAVRSLIGGRIDAVPAFWNAEGVALRERGFRTREFRVEDFGAPVYPEVVLVTARRSLQRHRDAIARAVAAVRDGVAATRADEPAAVAQVAREAGTDDTGLVAAQLRAIRGAFAPGLRLDERALERWAAFDARIGLVPRAPDIGRAFDLGVAAR